MSDTLREPRRAYRSTDDRLLGGVAAGVADHLDADVLHVRVAFLLLSLLGGFGVAVYAGLWAFLPVEGHPTDAAPGLEAATRRGTRTSRAEGRGRDVGVALSLGLVGLGVVIFLQRAGLWVSPRLFWPLVVAASGVALLWWQSDNRVGWLSERGGWKAWLRIVAGAALVMGALWLALFQAGASSALGQAVGAIVLAVVGVGLVLGPWLLRLSRDLQHERRERIRTQERADVAAHLHDSVLQTLALIQRQADNPALVAQLARTQERELRLWLFDDTRRDGATLKSGLQQAVAEVEDATGVPVELVTVGDAIADDHVAALVAAAREAMVNAARHSQAQRVDVYAEAGPGGVEVFVRDRGVGFDLDEVPDDRRGMRGSIFERMGRHGGSAEVRSSRGEGTEVRLAIPRGDGEERAR